MNSWQEATIEVGKLNFHYYRTATLNKPSLVLAHGFSDNGLCWTRVVRELEADFDIIMVDARNHGKSDRAESSLRSMVDDLAGVISRLNLDKPIVMGHSMGASSVAGVAADYPQLVSRIILEDPPWTTRQAQNNAESAGRATGFKRYLATLSKLSDEQLLKAGQKQHPDWHVDDFPAWVASKRQVSETAMNGLSLGDWNHVVDRIQCPTLLIYADAERDGIVKQTVVDQIEAKNKQIKGHHIMNAGHNTRRENFSDYMEAVKAFLFS